MYKVQEINKNTITLDDDSVHKRASLLKVPNETLTPVITESRNVFQQATKENKTKNLHKKLEILPENIVPNPSVNKVTTRSRGIH